MVSRQHLIDPELCIRCNTCESVCKPKAITHDSRNYVVDFDKCNACGDCLPPCPTGAIDNWRNVTTPWSLDVQLTWDMLPSEGDAPATTEPAATIEAGASEVPDEVRALEREAQRAQGGEAPPPWSAAHPYVGLYSKQRPAIATVSGNYRLTEPSSPVDIRHIVLDFGRTAMPVLEGQSIGILPPGRDEHGREHHVRLYSVASPRNGERPGYNNVALTVKRVTEDREGRPTRGVASNYLCDLRVGDKVSVVGPFGASFLMPNHPGAKLLMVCTGTGSAPMRAMTERRRRRMNLAEGGEILLFFGARKPEELPYFGPLQKLPKSLIDVEFAFSRDERYARGYVQDRMLARADKVGEWLESDDCFVYLCGHKRMEDGVLEAFAKIAERRGQSWSALRELMRAEGRFHVETY
jgi:benzoyl-CoA 2,3-dioxygenase component A